LRKYTTLTSIFAKYPTDFSLRFFQKSQKLSSICKNKRHTRIEIFAGHEMANLLEKRITAKLSGDFLFSQKFELFPRKLKYADDLAKNLAT
jgi:hypothetical protein